MRRTSLYLIALLGLLLSSFTDKETYRIYDSRKGKELTEKRLLRKLRKADVILFGETHNSVVDHEVELRLAEALFRQKGNNLILGAEMFEADDQLVLNEFLSGLIQEKHLISEAKIWKNYKSDYAPLVHFAKEKALRFVATNVPGRYAAVVAREGMQALSALQPEAKQFIAPLPVEVDLELSSYKNMLTMMEGHLGPGTDTEQMVAAQALKDATMAHFILKSHSKGKVFLHINGRYHSDYYQGIAHYLKKYAPGIDVLSITSVRQADIAVLEEENRERADFIVVMPMDAPKSY